ncbi:CASP protein 4D1 [Spatholobus suberectus]|nr:CASP protein 4D1 [Spatholobus suberectus]
MVTKRVANSMLVLRIVSIATAVATIALLVTNNSTFDNGAELKYQDFTSYSLVVAIAAIACAYCIVQLPFAIYYAIRQKRLISNRFMPEFDFYGDKVTSLLLATGIGAGFVLSVELKKFIDSKTYGSNDYKSTYNKIFIRGFIASTFLLITFLSMVVISFISSNNRSKALFCSTLLLLQSFIPTLSLASHLPYQHLSFDDYGRAIGGAPSLSKVVKVMPKVDGEEDAKSREQKFLVKLLVESGG